MELKDIITLSIAGWGAILSTIMAWQKFIVERKKIKITLIELIWHANHKISIVNIGHRPITINEIELTLSNAEPRIPSTARFKKQSKLPSTLSVGGMPIEFYLTDAISYEIIYNHATLNITVFDVEGNAYTKYSKEEHDERYNKIRKMK